MTPAARVAAAITILDAINAGRAAEPALLNWARASRFAGSGDRAAVRDHVFRALRCRRSFAALGGDGSGRGLMLGALRASGTDPADIFTGAGYAPAPLSPPERAHLAAPVALEGNVALDCPDWLAPMLRASLGPQFAAVMEALRHRAPVFLRANLARATRAEAQQALAVEGVDTRPSPLAGTALEVIGRPRKIQSTEAFRAGLIELQDAASQAVVEGLPLASGDRVLDYCAGGGGKALAIAARGDVTVHAHDADPRRMRDLPVRAARARVDVAPLDTAAVAQAAPFDLVLLDVPCSGSGSWRRNPEGKWLLNPEGLAELLRLQADILARAAPLVAPGGWLAYATCSLLVDENEARIDAFLSEVPGWRCHAQRRWSPCDGADGFFLALLTQD